MALALYRKYRPATFAEVVGQEHVTDPLRTALAAGRINHAYLFSGPRGCGKTSSARILARSLNCVQGPTPDPCGICPSCIALAPEGPGSLDVVELDAASHGGVEDTRDLRDRAFYMPAESRYRVFIIDEAHMVSPQGFNALLKIVEEPPEHLVFIFATTEPDKVLTTIRSRTHHYPFRLIAPAVLRALLERLCAEEDVEVEPAVYPLVIQAGGGSARDSLSVLDQLLAGAGPEGVTYRNAVALLGVTDAALLDEMADALAAGDGASVFGVVDKVVEAGHDPRRFAADLLQRMRDLVILGAVPDAAAKGLVDAPGDQLSLMAGQVKKLGTATSSRFAELLHTGLVEMRGTTSPRLVLELMCARMLLPAASLSDGALLQRLERMERRLSIAGIETGPNAAESVARRLPEPKQSPIGKQSPAGPDRRSRGSRQVGRGSQVAQRVAADPGAADAGVTAVADPAAADARSRTREVPPPVAERVRRPGLPGSFRASSADRSDRKDRAGGRDPTERTEATGADRADPPDQADRFADRRRPTRDGGARARPRSPVCRPCRHRPGGSTHRAGPVPGRRTSELPPPTRLSTRPPGRVDRTGRRPHRSPATATGAADRTRARLDGTGPVQTDQAKQTDQARPAEQARLDGPGPARRSRPAG